MYCIILPYPPLSYWLKGINEFQELGKYAILTNASGELLFSCVCISEKPNQTNPTNKK